VCIGEHLSRVEMALSLVHLRQRFEWQLHADSEHILPVAMFTLRPSRNIMMDIAPVGELTRPERSTAAP
jgi:cytochrome P450